MYSHLPTTFLNIVFCIILLYSNEVNNIFCKKSIKPLKQAVFKALSLMFRELFIKIFARILLY